MKNKITGDLEYVIDEPQLAVSEFHGFELLQFDGSYHYALYYDVLDHP